MSFSPEAFLVEVGAYVASTIGTTFGPTGYVYVGKLPDKINEAVAVVPSGGILGDPSDPIRKPTTQIVVRSPNYRTGMSLASSIFTGLDNKANELATYKAFSTPSALFTGDYVTDQKNNYIFYLNFHWTLIWV